jgi:hypothetical protein
MGLEPTSIPASRRSGPQASKAPAGGASYQARPARPSSFAGHYGQLIAGEGIAPIPRALYVYQGALNLSPQQVWFISYVLSHKWGGDLPHPGLQELARHSTLGSRQIKKIKNSLVYEGLLVVTPRYGAGGEQDANSYDFGQLLDRLERLMAAHPDARDDELAENPPTHVDREAHIDMADGSPAYSPADTAQAAGISSPDHSFAARFGRVVLRRGVAAIPRALFTYQADLGISPQQLWFIGYILSFQWSTELPYPSLRKMAQNTGYSERQIHRIKDSLVSAGYLRVIERRGDDGRDTTSAYDFSELLRTLNVLIRKHSLRRGEVGAKVDEADEAENVGDPPISVAGEDSRQTSHQLPPEPLQTGHVGGELYVSGGVNSTTVEGEPCDSGRVNCMSAGGVNPVSEGGVNCMSYRIESIKEESDKEEPHQQHQAENEENDEARENAYYALVDVGVFPGTALEISQQLDPDFIIGWVRYYLSVLSEQSNLSNPLGVLVSKLRSGEEPPYLPSSADLHSLRLQYSRYR